MPLTIYGHRGAAGYRPDPVVVAEPTSSAELPGRLYNSAAGNYLFHLELEGEAPERWVSREDDAGDGSPPLRLECYWIPLAQGHVLAAGQGALLGQL